MDEDIKFLKDKGFIKEGSYFTKDYIIAWVFKNNDIYMWAISYNNKNAYDTHKNYYAEVGTISKVYTSALGVLREYLINKIDYLMSVTEFINKEI